MPLRYQDTFTLTYYVKASEQRTQEDLDTIRERIIGYGWIIRDEVLMTETGFTTHEIEWATEADDLWDLHERCSDIYDEIQYGPVLTLVPHLDKEKAKRVRKGARLVASDLESC